MKTFLTTTLIAAAVLAGSAAFVFTPQARAVTVSPVRVELAGDPGQTISGEFKVFNEEQSARVWFTQFENFEAAPDESGTPAFVGAREGLATWIRAQSSITLGPNERKTVPFTVTIPADAQPGGYFASILLRTTPPIASEGGEVSIGSRLGTLVLFRVNGDIKEGVQILEFATKNKQRWFNSLPVEFYYRFQNSGGDRVRPLGNITVKNLFGMTSKIINANRSEGSVLPSSIRRFESAWMKGGGGEQDLSQELPSRPQGFFAAAKHQWRNFAMGYYRASLDLSYGSGGKQRATSSFGFFIFPWQLLVFIAVILTIAVLIIWMLLKRYNRYIITQSRRK